jgi:hypothetical protein
MREDAIREHGLRSQSDVPRAEAAPCVRHRRESTVGVPLSGAWVPSVAIFMVLHHTVPPMTPSCALHGPAFCPFHRTLPPAI